MYYLLRKAIDYALYEDVATFSTIALANKFINSCRLSQPVETDYGRHFFFSQDSVLHDAIGGNVGLCHYGQHDFAIEIVELTASMFRDLRHLPRNPSPFRDARLRGLRIEDLNAVPGATIRVNEPRDSWFIDDTLRPLQKDTEDNGFDD